MKTAFTKRGLLGLIIIFSLAACSNTADNINDFSEAVEPQSVQTTAETVADTDNQPSETVSVQESVDIDVTETEREDLDALPERTGIVFDNYTKDIIEYEKNWVSLVLPNDNVNIDELRDCLMLRITLMEKTDLSFLSRLTQLKELSICNGESDPAPLPLDESYVESYDFLNSLNNLVYVDIYREPNFSTEYLKNLSNLKYLELDWTNVELTGCFPDIKEVSLVACELSSDELYDFFPNLTGLETCYMDISLKSVGKMDRLEILRLSLGQSYKEINELANNKRLKSLTLSSHYSYSETVDDEFLFELTELQKLWCIEGMFSEETINRFKEINPQCDVFDNGL